MTTAGAAEALMSPGLAPAKLRVLLLILQFPPDVNSNGTLMAQVGEELTARGHQVSVVTTFPHYARFQIADGYRGKLFERAAYGSMDVLRLWVYASGTKQRMAHRLFSYLSFNVLAAVAGIMSRRRFDVVLSPNGSFFTGITAQLLRIFKGMPFIYNVQDLYPETPVAAGQLKSRPAIATLGRVERHMYRAANAITVITPSFRDNIVSKGILHAKVRVIPNFVDTEFIRPLPKVNSFSERLGLADKFVVLHAGNVGYVYDLETLLDAAVLLRDDPSIVFVINGEGVAKATLERKVEALGLTNVRFLPFQSRDDLPLLRASADVQVSLYRHNAARFSMPSKIYEIMASGRPLLASADADSDVARLVHATGCGICVEPEDARALADALRNLRHDPLGCASMADEGRRHAVDSYSRGRVGEQYEILLREVVSAHTLPRS